MYLNNSENTCSQTELCQIYPYGAESFEEELRRLLTDAKDGNRKSIIANLTTDQKNKYGAKLEAAGFICVGNYWGNSNQQVHIFIHGIEPIAKKIVRKTRVGLLKARKAISR